MNEIEATFCIGCGQIIEADEMECPLCNEIQALTPGVTAEMLRAVRKHDCLVYGHDWQIFKNDKDRPQAVYCQRCGGDAGLKRCRCGH